MRITDTTQNLMLASILAAMVVTPSLADNVIGKPVPLSITNAAYLGDDAQSAASPISAESVALPSAQVRSDVRYVTGGIGDEERTALEAVKQDYNLHVTSSAQDGAFTGETYIKVRNARGEEMLGADAGPLFFAHLPAGTYTVEATHEQISEQRKVTVGNKTPSSVTFRW